MPIDKIDRKILYALQNNARITYSQLATLVGLTTSPCIERVKKLTHDGVIKGYFTELSANKLDMGLVMFVQIRLDRTSSDSFAEFRKNVIKLNQVQECYLVTGDFDFLIKVRLKDMDAYRNFLEDELLSISGVLNSTSIAAMETIKESLTLCI